MTDRVEVDLGSGVRAAFTTVDFGNLSLSVGAEVPARAARTRLAAWLGSPIAWPVQVHGSAVHVVDRPGDAVAEADAVVTAAGIGLAVLVADCVPVLVADADSGVVGAVHAGRRGVVAGVVGAAIDALVGLGARRDRLRAAIGPAVCGRCYEVPGELASLVEAAVPGTRALTDWGTPSLDLPAAVSHQLRSAGVEDIQDLGLCTVTDHRFFSHRGHLAQGRAPGRVAAAIRGTHGVSALPRGAAGLA